MVQTWFFSDPHFGHANIIKYAKRPFAHVDEMDEVIIQNINGLVKPGDQLWCLGDWCFSRDRKDYLRKAAEYLARIKCKNIHLIFGNHDKPEIATCGFRSARDYFKLKISDEVGKQRIILSHYAFKVWDGSHHGSYNLYGHSHGSLPDDLHSLSFDVGVDSHGYRPISYEQVKEIMSRKVWKPVDRHGIKDDEPQE